MRYYIENTNKGFTSDDMANYIAEEIQKQTNVTDNEAEQIADDIFSELETMRNSETKVFYGFEVWTAEKQEEATCRICGKIKCNCNTLIDEARGK